MHDDLIRELEQRYVLVPKNRLWHFLGGAVSFAVLAFSLSFAGVLAGMKSDAAVKAGERIQELKREAEEHVRALGADQYIRYNRGIALRSSGGTYVGATPGVDVVNVGRSKGDHERFVIEAHP